MSFMSLVLTTVALKISSAVLGAMGCDVIKSNESIRIAKAEENKKQKIKIMATRFNFSPRPKLCLRLLVLFEIVCTNMNLNSEVR